MKYSKKCKVLNVVLYTFLMNRKINRTYEVWLSTKLKVLTNEPKDKSDDLTC